MKILLTTIFLTLTIISHGQEILWDSTFVVQNISFKVIAGRTDTSNYAQIVRDKVDTTTINGVNGNIEVVHFNSDNFPDIILTYLSNVPINDLYLFDPKTKTYREIDNMKEFPEAKRLESNDNLYYSYQRAGCADMNWISHLFKINNDTATKIGTIHGQGCENDTRQKIEILNVVTLDKIYVIETLPIDTITEFQDYKWGFIKDYWNNNFEKFEK